MPPEQNKYPPDFEPLITVERGSLAVDVWRARIVRHVVSCVLGATKLEDEDIEESVRSLDEEMREAIARIALQEPHPSADDSVIWATEAMTNAELYGTWKTLTLGLTAQKEVVACLQHDPAAERESENEAIRGRQHVKRPEKKVGDPIIDEGGWGLGIMDSITADRGKYTNEDQQVVVWGSFGEYPPAEPQSPAPTPTLRSA